MAKKMKKPKPKKVVAIKKKVRRALAYMMVIRVRVPAEDVPSLKINDVFGIDKRGNLRDLEILNAYYDKTGQPNAMPGC